MAEQLRPRFRYYVENTPQEVCDALKTAFKKNARGFTGSALPYHVVVDYPKNGRHYWSPQLDLSLEKYDQGTLIRGMVGPRPNVWTKFMFFYAIAGLSGVAGVIIGTGQWSMGTTPNAFWLLPLSIIIFVTVYLIGQSGKRIAHDESVQIHNFLMDNIHNPVELELDQL